MVFLILLYQNEYRYDMMINNKIYNIFNIS